jgi:hypothetical protein
MMASHREMRANLELQWVKIESLHASVSELHANSLEHRRQPEQDGERIRTLVRIAEGRSRGLSDLEGTE